MTKKRSKRQKPSSHPAPIASSPAQLKNTQGVQAFKEERHHFSGPIPHPQILEGYEVIVPGAAERIISMAESQSEHRQDLERRIVRSDIVKSYLGIACALIIAIFTLSLSAYCALQDKTIVAGILGVGGLGGLVSTFIYGTKARKKERDEKTKPID